LATLSRLRGKPRTGTRIQVEGGAMFSFLMKARKMRKTLAECKGKRERETERETDRMIERETFICIHMCWQTFIDLV